MREDDGCALSLSASRLIKVFSFKVRVKIAIVE